MMEPDQTPQMFRAQDLGFPARPELGGVRTADLLNVITDNKAQASERIGSLLELVGFRDGKVKVTLPELNHLSSRIDMTREREGRLRTELDPFGTPHAHAVTIYSRLTPEAYFNAIGDLIEAATQCSPEINFHIPNEILFESQRDFVAGEKFMAFVDAVSERIAMPVVWENAVRLKLPEYSLVENQSHIPRGRNLCLDIGHLALGASSKEEALGRIDRFEQSYGERIKHLHLHVNDLVHDQHLNDPAVVVDYLGQERFERLVRGRSFIFEAGTIPDSVKNAQ